MENRSGRRRRVKEEGRRRKGKKGKNRRKKEERWVGVNREGEGRGLEVNRP